MVEQKLPKHMTNTRANQSLNGKTVPKKAPIINDQNRRCKLLRGVHRCSFYRRGTWRIYIRSGRGKGSETLWSTSAPTRAEAEATERLECPPERVIKLVEDAKSRRQAAATGRLKDICDAIWLSAKKRAKHGNILFTITKQDVADFLERQEYKCAISGIKFRAETKSTSYRSPFRPSIDRITPSGGYVPGNVRLVLVAVNVALSDFGDDTFYRIVDAVAERRGWSPAPGL